MMNGLLDEASIGSWSRKSQFEVSVRLNKTTETQKHPERQKEKKKGGYKTSNIKRLQRQRRSITGSKITPRR